MAEKKWYESVVPADAVTPREIDTSVPHIARMYDYWLGGKDNYAADRVAGERAAEANPLLREGVRGNRAFLRRSVRYLAAEAGIRQFLDIGTGIPSAGNTHEVAQAVAAQSRVVYADNDPIVLNHARALLTGTPGTTSYIDGDIRDTATILDKAAETLDFSQPIAVQLIAVLHCIPDSDDPRGILRNLVRAVPSGSFLTISHPGSDFHPEATGEMLSRVNSMMPDKLTFRTRDEVTAFFDGVDLLDPGVVRVPEWRPDSEADLANPAEMWGGVGRKP